MIWRGWLGALCCVMAAHASAASPQLPYGLQLGHSTVEQAEASWSAAGAHEAQRGNAAAAGARAVDGMGTLPNPHILLIDVPATGFEGFSDRVTRFQFFDGTLFAVTVRLNRTFDQNVPKDQQLS